MKVQAIKDFYTTDGKFHKEGDIFEYDYVAKGWMKEVKEETKTKKDKKDAQ